MSKYTIQDTIEENGRKIFENALDTNYFLLESNRDTVDSSC